ncbi:MAG TPA: SDR family NAD(P)-dependent oxidoreductase [Rhizobiaceae bacterium]|nr:SDR family NAD(P)-dependent oxidoreductase [Rhizobiaceae bacterium]
MTLYRATPKDGVAWITGASTGIGRALALDLAREGYAVAVTARDEDNLTTLVGEAAGLPGRVVPFPCDVTDEAGMERTVAEIEREVGPLALAVFNAGNYFPTWPQRLEALNFSKTFEVNVMGVIYGLVPALDRMKERRRGHLVIVGSVTSYFGWPATAAYGSSKAALFNLAEGLKYDLDKMNVRIQVLNPGFIDTPLTRKNSFAMPALMPVDKASQRIVRALKSGGFEVTFPWRFTWFLKFLRILPQPLRFAFINRATGWHKR